MESLSKRTDYRELYKKYKQKYKKICEYEKQQLGGRKKMEDRLTLEKGSYDCCYRWSYDNNPDMIMGLYLYMYSEMPTLREVIAYEIRKELSYDSYDSLRKTLNHFPVIPEIAYSVENNYIINNYFGEGKPKCILFVFGTMKNGQLKLSDQDVNLIRQLDENQPSDQIGKIAIYKESKKDKQFNKISFIEYRDGKVSIEKEVSVPVSDDPEETVLAEELVETQTPEVGTIETDTGDESTTETTGHSEPTAEAEVAPTETADTAETSESATGNHLPQQHEEISSEGSDDAPEESEGEESEGEESEASIPHIEEQSTKRPKIQKTHYTRSRSRSDTVNVGGAKSIDKQNNQNIQNLVDFLRLIHIRFNTRQGDSDGPILIGLYEDKHEDEFAPTIISLDSLITQEKDQLVPVDSIDDKIENQYKTDQFKFTTHSADIVLFLGELQESYQIPNKTFILNSKINQLDLIINEDQLSKQPSHLVSPKPEQTAGTHTEAPFKDSKDNEKYKEVIALLENPSLSDISVSIVLRSMVDSFPEDLIGDKDHTFVYGNRLELDDESFSDKIIAALGDQPRVEQLFRDCNERRQALMNDPSIKLEKESDFDQCFKQGKRYQKGKQFHSKYTTIGVFSRLFNKRKRFLQVLNLKFREFVAFQRWWSGLPEEERSVEANKKPFQNVLKKLADMMRNLNASLSKRAASRALDQTIYKGARDDISAVIDDLIRYFGETCVDAVEKSQHDFPILEFEEKTKTSLQNIIGHLSDMSTASQSGGSGIIKASKRYLNKAVNYTIKLDEKGTRRIKPFDIPFYNSQDTAEGKKVRWRTSAFVSGITLFGLILAGVAGGLTAGTAAAITWPVVVGFLLATLFTYSFRRFHRHRKQVEIIEAKKGQLRDLLQEQLGEHDDQYWDALSGILDNDDIIKRTKTYLDLEASSTDTENRLNSEKERLENEKKALEQQIEQYDSGHGTDLAEKNKTIESLEAEVSDLKQQLAQYQQSQEEDEARMREEEERSLKETIQELQETITSLRKELNESREENRSLQLKEKERKEKKRARKKQRQASLETQGNQGGELE